MKVLKATQEQFESLDGWSNGNNILKFTKDADGNWIVGKQILSNGNFSDIHDQLSQLEEIDYKKPDIEI